MEKKAESMPFSIFSCRTIRGTKANDHFVKRFSAIHYENRPNYGTCTMGTRGHLHRLYRRRWYWWNSVRTFKSNRTNIHMRFKKSNLYLFWKCFDLVMKNRMQNYLETVSSIVIVGRKIVVSLRWIGQHIFLNYFSHRITIMKSHRMNRMVLLWFGIQNSRKKPLRMCSIARVLLCQPVLQNFIRTLY